MNKNPQIAKKIILIITASLLGYFSVQQINANQRLSQLTNAKVTSAIALEVKELIKSETKLRKEIGELEAQKASLSDKYSSRAQKQATLDEIKRQATIINGKSKIKGPGVIIKIDDKITVQQLTDIINAIRNIGAEGIEFNNQRIVLNSGFADEMIEPENEIKVICDGKLLEDSLKRRGGILEQIGINARIWQEEELTLVAKSG